MGLSDYQDLSDPELIAICLRGDAGAWAALIARYQGLLFHIARDYGLETADAEDVFQSVSLKLCLHLQELRERERLSAWLAAVTRQECLRLLRRRPTGSLEALREVADDAESAAERLLRAERAHEIRRSLSTLPEICRRLLTLLYGETPLPYAQAAERLGLPVGSIGPKRARCLERLKKKIDENDD